MEKQYKTNKIMTAVEWLVNKILVEVDKCDDKGNIIGVYYWNAYRSCTNLLEYVNKAKRLEKQQLIEMHDKGFDSVQQLNDDYAIGFARFYKMANNNEYHLYPNASIEEHLEIFKKENGL